MAKLTALLKQNLERAIEKQGINSDLVDALAFWDSQLTYQENKKNILEQIGKRAVELDLKGLEEKARVEGSERELEHAGQEFEKAIERIVAESNPKLGGFYNLLDNYVEMVAGGYSNSLLVYGNFGVGKSHRIIERLGRLNVEFEHFSGAITPLELYHLLHETNGKVLFLDDVGSSIFENPRAVEILKPALQEVAGKRFVNYSSSSEKLKAPAKFEYTGRLIIATNELPDSTMSLRALISRPLVLELSFSHKELVQIFYIIAKQKYKNTSEGQRNKVVEFIKNNADEACDNLSIRTLLKGFEMVAFNEKEWEELFKPILKVNDRLKLIIENEGTSRQEQLETWKESTGLTAGSFYRYLRVLKKRRGIM